MYLPIEALPRLLLGRPACRALALRRYTAAMKTTRLAPLLIALVALCLLAGCGNKGDLVRPEKTPASASA